MGAAVTPTERKMARDVLIRAAERIAVGQDMLMLLFAAWSLE